jgi:hypothetical protein
MYVALLSPKIKQRGNVQWALVALCALCSSRAVTRGRAQKTADSSGGENGGSTTITSRALRKGIENEVEAQKRKRERRPAIGAPKKIGGDPVQPTTGRAATPTAPTEKTEAYAGTKKKEKRQ